MIIEVGKIYSNYEMAKWFGVAHSTFRSHKRERLAELEDYATFEIMKDGKIHIISLHDEELNEYVKMNRKIGNFVDQHFLEVWDMEGLETVSRVAAKLYLMYQKQNPKEELNERSFVYHTSKARNKYLPWRKREWCKMYGTVGGLKTIQDKARNLYESFTPEQKQDFFNEFYKRYKRDNVAQAILDLNEKYEKGILKSDAASWEAAWQEFNETTGANELPYKSFLGEMANRFACDWVINGTKSERT